MIGWKTRISTPGLAAALGAVVAAVYGLTAARSLSFIDSGELATVAWTLGIGHPTGYPLFTIIGYIASHAPVPLTPIFKLNLLSSFLGAAGIGLFFLVVRRFLAEARPPVRRQGPQGGDAAVHVAAAFGAASLAFSSTWWAVSTSIEVYPLHALFLVLLIGLFGRAFPPRGKPGGGAAAHLFAYAVGLSFSNHMSTVYLAPAFLTLYFIRRGGGRESFVFLAALAPAFLLGFSVNLYLPVRAAQEPMMNWGNPTDLTSIFRHLRGKQYDVWLFSSLETTVRQLSHFLATIGPRFSYVPVALAIWGMVVLFRSGRERFLLILLAFLGCLAFATNYEIEDIESYFLLADVATAMAASAGVLAIVESARGRARTAVVAAAGLFLGCQAALTWPQVDQSGLRHVDQYSRQMLGAAEPGAVIISYQWDYFVSASYYLQAVEGYRPDVMVVDKELLRRTWYLDYLRRRYPALLTGLEREIDAFLVELRKFENDLPYDPRVIEGRYVALISGIAGRHYPDRAVYVTADIELDYTRGYRRIPHGLMQRLRREGDPDLWKEVPVTLDPPPRSDPYLDAITMLAARAEYLSAGYQRWRGDAEGARRAAERSLAIRPDYPDPRRLLRDLTPGPGR